MTACPLSFLSRLRVLYLPWAHFVPLPSSVGFVSTTSPCADTVSTASPTVNYTVRPRPLPKPRAPLKSRVPCNLEQRVYNPSSYRLLSDSNGSGPSLRVRVRVRTEPLPNWWSGLSTHPNCQFGYGSMQISQPVWIGRVVSGSPSGSIC